MVVLRVEQMGNIVSVHSTYVFFVTRATIWGKIVKPAVLTKNKGGQPQAGQGGG